MKLSVVLILMLIALIIGLGIYIGIQWVIYKLTQDDKDNEEYDWDYNRVYDEYDNYSIN